jgi:hypothetical protein
VGKTISRRDFLKLGGLAAGSLGFRFFSPLKAPIPPEEFLLAPSLKGRVTARQINVYSLPDFMSRRIERVARDTLLSLREEIVSIWGPKHNPRWYRLEKGYVHSGYIQRLEQVQVNKPVTNLPEDGQLGEITVPFVQSYRKLRRGEWQPLYRLYYRAVFRVVSLETGPDGRLWYGLKDDLLNVIYCVPGWSVRLIAAEELAPISPDVSEQDKRIEISLLAQTLTAYEGRQVVLHTSVSTGIPGHLLDSEEEQSDDQYIDTETPSGQFRVQVKIPSRHMGDGRLTADLNAYELPGVPWVSYFYKTGVAFHGVYWHDNFGRKMSRGCVNLRPNEAKWLYRWCTPAAGPQDWNVKGWGTLVQVI